MHEGCMLLVHRNFTPWCSLRLADEDWLGHNAVWFAIDAGKHKTAEVLEALMAEEWLAAAAPFSPSVRVLRAFGDAQLVERKVSRATNTWHLQSP